MKQPPQSEKTAVEAGYGDGSIVLRDDVLRYSTVSLPSLSAFATKLP